MKSKGPLINQINAKGAYGPHPHILKGNWNRMSFKAGKSRSLILKRGKVTDRFSFSLWKTTIPSVPEKTVKSLGKLFISDLKDTTARQESSDNLNLWLLAVSMSVGSSRPGYISTASCLVSSGRDWRMKSQFRLWRALWGRSACTCADGWACHGAWAILFGQSNKLHLPFTVWQRRLRSIGQ